MPQRIDGEEAYHGSTAVAALVRVAQHHGLTFSVAEFVRANPFDGPEPSPALLLRMAERAGLRGQLMHIERGELGTLARTVPALLILSDGRTVVLDRVHERDGTHLALIEDPASNSGISALIDEPRLFDIWGGQVLLLKRRWKLTDPERPFGFTWLVGQMIQERKLFRDIVVAAFMMSLLSLFPDRKSTRLNSSHCVTSRMPSSA